MWNFSDSGSVPHRDLPSLRSPERMFTLRYYELRTLDDEDSIRTDKNQMTHAVNRRKIERWRDVDLPSIEPDKRHAFIRRCASFHVSPKAGTNDSTGWDGKYLCILVRPTLIVIALMLVDPALNSCPVCAEHNAKKHPRDKSADQVDLDGKPNESTCQPSCLILEDPRLYPTRKELWFSRIWKGTGSCREVRHNSQAYHGGCPSLVAPTLVGPKDTPIVAAMNPTRNMASPFDELVLYWTEYANKELIGLARENPVNSAYYLLKFIAYQWSHQLELIAYSVANTEWFADGK